MAVFNVFSNFSGQNNVVEILQKINCSCSGYFVKIHNVKPFTKIISRLGLLNLYWVRIDAHILKQE